MSYRSILGITSIFIFVGLMPNLLNANHFSNAKMCFSVASGGLVIAIQGLTSAPILLEFKDQNKIGKLNSNVEIIITATDGSIYYQELTESVAFDFSEFYLVAGNYILEVKIGDVLKIVNFTYG